MILRYFVLTAALILGAGSSRVGRTSIVSSESPLPESSWCPYPRESARFDECVCGQLADALAARLELEAPPMVILIDASATKDERLRLEVKRAENARDFLIMQKGVDPGRIVIRWCREDRASNGKWGGSLRLVALRPGDTIPALADRDPSWQSATAGLAPN